ncbi:MAG: ABC transporter permease [Patescibacteria group bacterium]
MDTFLDSLQAAYGSLTAKKMRSVLSILGVVIGILTISSLLTISFGVRDQIGSYIGDLGANLLVVLPGDTDQSGGFASQFGVSTLTESDVEAIRREVPEVINLNSAMIISHPKFFILAGSPGIQATFNLKLDQGQFPDQNDEFRRSRVAVVGAKVTENPIVIRGQTYEVVGHLSPVTNASSLGGPDVNSMVVIPLSTGWEVTNTKQIFRISMQAPTAETVGPLRERIESTMLQNHRGEKDFSVLTQDDILSLANDILDLITAMISAIAAISLVVGGIGIMNIMLVTVNERTREIGIRKAVGATRGVIMLQFLIESILLTFMAGVVAVGIFSAMIALVKSHVPIPLSLDWYVILIALGFSILAGIVFGLIPAWQASRKDPIEALRYE